MINSISITGVPPYEGGAYLNELNKINYVFGPNGSGKSAIARLIKCGDSSNGIEMKWSSENHEEILIYDQEFVNRNISSTGAPGIYTMGEENIMLRDQIRKLNDEIETAQTNAEGFLIQIGNRDDGSGRRGELESARLAALNSCWDRKKRLPEPFDPALRGAKQKESFFEKVCKEAEEGVELKYSKDELIHRAEILFGKNLVKKQDLTIPSFDQLNNAANNPIMSKSIIGSGDVPISELILELNNGDWVNEGRRYLDKAGEVCPFCQQKIQNDLKKQLNDFFDDEFEKGVLEVEEAGVVYRAESNRILKALENLLTSELATDELDKLNNLVSILKSVTESNYSKIKAKLGEPSLKIELQGLSEVEEQIHQLLLAHNIGVRKFNEMISNEQSEKNFLVRQIWAYIVQECENDLKAYHEASERLGKALAGLTAKRDAQLLLVAEKKTKLEELESKITSIKPSVDRINSLLRGAGFTRFRLEVGGEEDSYRIVRKDGSDATKTLSEGERTFISFVYFYATLDGSLSKSGTTTRRIVVLDDPISSLDSDVLFTVSAMVRKMASDVREGNSNIAQLIVLTHNTIFHHEITFDKSGEKNGDRSFYLITKRSDESLITKCNNNPVASTYEQLWNQIRGDDLDPVTARNAMRRILENFFNLYGGQPLEVAIERLDGDELTIAKSLLLWVHAGSHGAFEDYDYVSSSSTVEEYRNVFERVFEANGHLSHYQYMMSKSID